MFVQFKMCTTSCPKQGMLNNIHYSFAFPLHGQCIFWGENKKKTKTKTRFSVHLYLLQLQRTRNWWNLPVNSALPESQANHDPLRKTAATSTQSKA